MPIVRDVKGVHSTQGDFLRELLDLSGILRGCNKLLLLIRVQELAAFAELSQLQLSQRDAVFGLLEMPWLRQDPSFIEPQSVVNSKIVYLGLE